ncbi:MAG: efflux RND transporter periplasmic adaptor subunit [Sphingobacteriales bacterium]|nr:MAG: efflux RND transporter periplasmic adaptor subunit [Sphingobacteriales bacterium]
MKRNHFFITGILLIVAGCGLPPERASHAVEAPLSGPAAHPKHPSPNDTVSIDELLRPTNESVIAQVRVTALLDTTIAYEIPGTGEVAYDTRRTGNLSARISGRIERLYVRYRYQNVSAGQRIMDLYSPELVTAQEQYLYILKNDADNASLLRSARERLLLLGMDEQQVRTIGKAGSPMLRVSIYSPYSGHLHEAGAGMQTMTTTPMGEATYTTQPLALKEGMYLQKGQQVLSVTDPSRAWAQVQVPGSGQAMIHKGMIVLLQPEGSETELRASVQLLEPFYRETTKSATVRVPFDNRRLQLPIGTRLNARFSVTRKGKWLPASSVLLLGVDEVVLRRKGAAFQVSKVRTGTRAGGFIQILEGITSGDSVALHAGLLLDSESFTKMK